MMGKVTLALGLGVGYILGTRAGRERFDQLKQTGAKVAQRPEVQQAKERIKTVVSEKLPTKPEQGKQLATDMRQRAMGVTTKLRRTSTRNGDGPEADPMAYASQSTSASQATGMPARTSDGQSIDPALETLDTMDGEFDTGPTR